MKFLRICRSVARTALQSLQNAWLLHAVSATTITTAFVILGGSLVLFLNVRAGLVGSQAGTHISAYLRTPAVRETDAAVREGFCSRPFVKDCVSVSAEQARTRFVAKNPELTEAVSSLAENPFPFSVEISLDPEFKDRAALRRLVQELGATEGVETVDDGGEWADRWITLLSLADWAMWTLGGLLALAMVFVVANTIKLIVYARRDEIEILNLVGATNGYIRAPFVLEGFLQGTVGALAALGFLHLLSAYSQRHVSLEWGGLWSGKLAFLTPEMQVGVVAAGAFLGIVGSSLAVGRFLRL